jgi:hypothetical protein
MLITSFLYIYSIILLKIKFYVINLRFRMLFDFFNEPILDSDIFDKAVLIFLLFILFYFQTTSFFFIFTIVLFILIKINPSSNGMYLSF